MALLMFWSSLGIGLKEINNAPCENLLSKTYESYTYGDNFTGYHWDYSAGTAPVGPQADEYLFHRNTTYYYVNSCEDREIEKTMVFMFVFAGWMAFLGLIAMGLTMLYFMIMLLVKRI